MSWDYISGFFDADGSVTAIVVNKGENKTIQVSFHYYEIDILKEIEKFIFDDIGIKGIIKAKNKVKDNHNTAYDLTYTYKRGLTVANKMILLHPKKKHKVALYNLIQEVTKRNGKYSDREKEKRDNLLKEFFNK